VLAWHEERDESFVASLEEVATQLKSTPELVRKAIESGDLLGGCFVDWAIPTAGLVQNHKL